MIRIAYKGSLWAMAHLVLKDLTEKIYYNNVLGLKILKSSRRLKLHSHYRLEPLLPQFFLHWLTKAQTFL